MEAITKDLAARINQEHQLATAALRESLTHAFTCGALLLEAKEQVGHGNFMSWLADNCEVSDRTARLYMRLAKNRPAIEVKMATVANLTMREAVELLAEPREENLRPMVLKEQLLPADVESYVSELEARADRAETPEQLKAVQKEWKAYSKTYMHVSQKITAKADDFAAREYLKKMEGAPIPEPSTDAHLLPLERSTPEARKHEPLFFGVNMWQKNLTGYCAEWGCWHTIEAQKEWGTYQGRPGWSGWGLEAAAAPRSCWQPVFCAIHENGDDFTVLVEYVRMFLADGKVPEMSQEIKDILMNSSLNEIRAAALLTEFEKAGRIKMHATGMTFADDLSESEWLQVGEALKEITPPELLNR
jgi:hypothetical protein